VHNLSSFSCVCDFVLDFVITPECAGLLRKHWHNYALYKIICTCGQWQEYGIPCVDAVTYYRKKGNETLQEIMDSESVSAFHKYPFYKN
jgi:hypothetical protein